MPTTDREQNPATSPTDAADAVAAARAAREEALRILLATPDDPLPVPDRVVPDDDVVVTAPTRATAMTSAPQTEPVSAAATMPVIHLPVALDHDGSLPVIPSAARAASAPLTLLEVGLGFLVILLAGALLFLGVNEFRARARVARGAAELRALAGAFENYHRETGRWPIASAHGTVPAGMEKTLLAETWSQPTPFGGHYAWLSRAHKTPALAITAFVPDAPLALSRDEQRQIDQLLDDGDLATGRFRSGFNGWPIYLLGGEN